MKQLNTSLLFFIAALCCNPHSAAQTDDRLSPQDQASTPEERAWLNTPSGRDLAFYVREQTGTAHGGILLIPDTGQHPAVAGHINTFRHTLAQHHWHTLAVDTGGQDAATIQQTIAAGIAYLNAKGVYNIAVLGAGEGAIHALRYVTSLAPTQEGQVHQIRALVMFNADNTASGVEGNALELLATLKLPVLDTYFGMDYQQQQLAAARKHLAQREQSQYRQSRLPFTGVLQPHQENRITKRIRGWLDNNVAGFMVDKR